MKTRLDQFTMAQYIDIVCGDRSHIDCNDCREADKVALSLIAEYNNIADPASSKARIIEGERLARTSARIYMARICRNIINVFGDYDAVKVILRDFGYNVGAYDNDRLLMKVDQIIRSEEYERERIMNERKAIGNERNWNALELRASFDRQTAVMMSHFKMSIEYERISASIYANLVAMAGSQQRKASN